jgi:sulfur-oxidizing protein SoxY
MRSLNRREALRAGGAAAVLLAGAHGLHANSPEVEAEIAKFTGGQPVEQGKITIDLPEIAENGNTVPLAIVVDSPMTTNDYIAELRVLADGNPRPGIASFRFTPQCGRAEAATRIRLAGSQIISAVARTSNGRFFIARKSVKVTIGGCGG